MTTKVINMFFNSFILVSLLIILCFDRSSSKVDLDKNETTYERFANVQLFSQHVGYIPIRHSHSARLFYFFFESRGSKNDPVVLCLPGGPGLGSANAIFNTNGPFRINDDLTLKWNDFGWDKAFNIIHVDQFIGTGFSYSTDHRDVRQNSEEVSKDLYDFLQGFFEAHPKFLENDFYIEGGSYSSRTSSLLASRIHQINMVKGDIHINLKGLSITNGDINPQYRYSSYPDFVYGNKLVSRSTYRLLKKLNKKCLPLINRCQTDNNVCEDAVKICRGFYNRMRKILGNRWHYDFRKHIESPPIYYWPKIENFFALDDVRRALGVENRTYVQFSKEVLFSMLNDSMKDYSGVIPQLLKDGIKVLIVSGEYDLICNWLGNLRTMESIKWRGHNQFLKTKLTSYKIGGKKVGKMKNTGPLTYVKVFDAGHGVIKDQPYVSFQIFAKWVNS